MIDGRWLSKADNKLHTQIGRARRRSRQAVRVPARRDSNDPAQRHQLRRRRRARHGRARSRSRQRGVRHAVGGEARLRDRRETEPALRAVDDRATRRRPPTRSPPRSTSAVPIRCRRRCRATCCKAASQADKTLQQTALFAGLLALTVGGLGIANVMSISVIQRSSEIGIRRAVGHSRSKIGAAVPARVAVRRHPRWDPRSRGRGRCRVSRVRVRALGRRDRLPPDPDLDGPRVARVGRRRAVPVDQGRAPRTARDAPPRLTVELGAQWLSSTASSRKSANNPGALAAEAEASAAADRDRDRTDLAHRDVGT